MIVFLTLSSFLCYKIDSISLKLKAVTETVFYYFVKIICLGILSNSAFGATSSIISISHFNYNISPIVYIYCLINSIVTGILNGILPFWSR